MCVSAYHTFDYDADYMDWSDVRFWSVCSLWWDVA